MKQHALDRALEFIDSWFTAQAEEMDTPGVVLAIHHEDKMVYERAFGVADLASKAPMRVDHMFHIASQSKMFTAMAILKLAEAGELSLEDRLSKFLPWLDTADDPLVKDITIVQVLSHRGGLLRDGPGDYWQLARPFPDKYAVREMAVHGSVSHEDLGRVKYSNLGYALLGEIIEQVTGDSYRRFMVDEIIKPLGLSHTFPSYNSDMADEITAGYTRPFRRQRYVAPKTLLTNALSPAVGWYSTASDMCHFLAAHFWGEERAGQAPEVGYRHWSPPGVRQAEYYCGMLEYTFGGHEIIGHDGSSIGHRTCTFADPVRKLAVSIMANAKDAPVMQMLHGVFQALDYFERRAEKPTPKEWEKFNARLIDMPLTVQVIATAAGIEAIYPDRWRPFATKEELQYIDPTTLKITKTHALASPGELINFDFDGDKIKSADFAGTKMLPKADYQQWLADNFDPVNT